MIAKILCVICFLILIWCITGCSALLPIGQEARYGHLGVELRYYPPAPNVLAEQPVLAK
jgi:hypothetical protein